MYLSIYLVSALVAVSAAFTLPEGTTDGFYLAYYNESGHEVHVKAPDMSYSPADLAPSKPAIRQLRSSDNQLLPRGGGTIWCGCDLTMVSQDCDAAVEDLKSQLTKSIVPLIGAGKAWYSIRGGVVAFMCNKNLIFPAGVGASHYGGDLAEITKACGLYVPGTRERDEGLDVGYMKMHEGLDFCGVARRGAAHHC
ncbi:hypothetical protein CkaCkLH20_02353 [Colletotrichum karsti]|uniref:Ecp2 effector protein domain-containing protein n=1 Tax=Colletotrichum karsti TaxID=1095194 RepID=A0A9P6ICP2_9PEZI|nr:uncharacterized protein CkaCkLH20_02353 [Colletotrichum karsti]KAF9880399.1 hypothetical protein CkaCkLH20_02353 [Colletotrichum karsti]